MAQNSINGAVNLLIGAVPFADSLGMAPSSSHRTGTVKVDSGELGLALDRRSEVPLYAQLAGSLRSQIESGALPVGARLPSTRELAEVLEVHRKTVVQAFQALEAEGWVEAGVGQGTFVRRPGGRPAPDGGTGSAFPWEEVGPSNPTRDEDLREFVLRQAPREDSVRFTGATPDPALFPADEFRGILDEVLRTEGVHALDYGPAAGLLSLREWLAARLSAKGIAATADQVLIVNGSQQGMDLVARTLVEPGGRVLVEEPSYSNGFRLFQSYGAQIDGVGTDEDGLDPEALRSALAKGPAQLLYVMPIFQNPTGAVLAPERIDPILETAAEHQLAILEDHFDADLVYEGEDPEPIRRRDTRGQVILLGTFSKILFPGLRLGWLLLPPPLVERFVQIKQMADLSSGLLVQHAMDLYCRRGLLDRHLERVRATNRSRLAALSAALEREMPEGVTWRSPRGGMTFWMTLPAEIDSLALLQTARRLGVEFSPGSLFFPNGGGARHLRLCYVRETEERIRTGVARLAEAVREEMARGREEPARPFV